MRLSCIIDPHHLNEDELINHSFFQKIVNEDQEVQNWRGPFTASKLIEVFLPLEETNTLTNSVKNEPTFMYTKSAQDSIGALNGKEAAQVNKKLVDFVSLKKSNPLAPFGKTDKAFSSQSYLAGFKHAHLTYDISVVYKYNGKINQFCIFGVFGHDELGTNPNNSSQRRQQAIGARFYNQAC